MKLTEVNKLSELLRLAVKDAKKFEEAGKIRVNGTYVPVSFDMGVWVDIVGDANEPVCCVCLAGAVLLDEMSKEQLKNDLLQHAEGESVFLNLEVLELAVQHRAFALDSLRTGYIREALFELCEALQESVSYEEIDEDVELSRLDRKWTRLFRETHKNGRLSWQQYEEMAKDLEGAGL